MLPSFHDQMVITHDHLVINRGCRGPENSAEAEIFRAEQLKSPHGHLFFAQRSVQSMQSAVKSIQRHFFLAQRPVKFPQGHFLLRKGA
jgi:hypothetical protein